MRGIFTYPDPSAACEAGFPVVLGSRAHLYRSAHRLPRGIYLAKSARYLGVRMFDIVRDLGNEIVMCDEKALVHGIHAVSMAMSYKDVTILKTEQVQRDKLKRLAGTHFAK